MSFDFKSWKATIAISLIVAINSDACAQVKFENPVKVDGDGLPVGMAIGDFDNNSYTDIAFLSSPDGKLHVIYNDGTYQFTTSVTEAVGSGYSYAISAADFNEDGRTDVATVNRHSPVNERLSILISTGTSFTKFSFSVPGPSESYNVTTGDFDNDGHADVLVPNVGQVLTWYKGDGLGGFTSQTANTITTGASMLLADLNNDAKSDLVVGRGDQMDIYISSGATLVKTTKSIGSYVGPMIATDFNTDGSKDIVGWFASGTAFIGKLTNNGSGSFGSLQVVPSSTSVGQGLASGDYNLDGQQDLAVGTYDGAGPAILLNGSGSFTRDPFTDERCNETIALAFVDFDKDGTPELAHLSSFGSLSIIKRTAGNFQVAHKRILGNIPLRGLSRDLNHDGNMDLVSASISNGAVAIGYGNGDLTFDENIYLLGTGYRVEHVEAGDFNSDGFDDILFCERYLSSNYKVKLALTNGAGIYQTPVEISSATGSMTLPGDFNLDGKLDFFCQSGVFIGNGAGAFSFQAMSIGSWPLYGNTAFLDANSGPDLVIGDAIDAWTLLNPGNGTFAAPVKVATTRKIIHPVAGQYDGDNLTDIFALTEFNRFLAFKNNGAGGFQENVFTVASPLIFNNQDKLTTADYNQDGLGDVAIALDRDAGGGNYIREIAVYLQRPDNTFRLKTEIVTLADAHQDLASADFNNDGSKEIVAFSVFNGIEVLQSHFVAEPTTQAGPISVIEKTDVTAKLGFVKGTGHGRLVLLRKSTFPAELPEDDGVYAANTQFGLGNIIGNNNFVVLRGDQEEVTITGLQEGTNYVATVFEYREDLLHGINNYFTSSFPSLAFKTKTNQTITFPAITTKTEGDPPFTPTNQASSGLPVLLSSSSANISISANEITIGLPGPVTVSATQSGDSEYMPAPVVNRTFCVIPTQPTITLSEPTPNSYLLTSSRSSHNQWLLNGQPIAGANNTTFQPVMNGIYTVMVDYDGCSAVSDPADVVTGLDESTATMVWPNPVSGTLTLNGIELKSVTLTSSRGEEFILPADALPGETRVNLSGLSTGIYFLSLGHGEIVRVVVNR